MIEHLLDQLRATEAAALAASKWIGTGDGLSADKVASEEMRERLNKIPFAGKIVIGEGKKDRSFGLFAGEKVGMLGEGKVKPYDLAVDPIDGTRPTITSGPEAMSVLAVAEADSLYTTEEFYMLKIAYGPDVAKKVDLNLKDSIERIIKQISQATGKNAGNLVVCLLDRPRHEGYVKDLRKLGVRIKLIQDCDISGAIATCLPDSGIDLLYGIGGAPEAVITACAMKCLKGGFKGQVMSKEGKVLDPKIYSIDGMVRGHCAFAATGITNGSLLRGVRFTDRGAVTNSVFMRSETGTVRWITAHHGS